ncbi:MAG: cellulase family glycosylhydrolase [Treponema sp.]|jgi:hypothetical protein|nr:cellulase family glycosylhydrolase [Treponema sp.]
MYIKGRFILDEQGRTLILRGCNLGGSSKVPADPPGASRLPDSLANPTAVSFVGRPFPLDEAAAHLDRLKSWGFTFLRLIVTWEALEHQGPGIYDEAYLAYLRKILLLMEERNMQAFIDPHQDAWSRWTGGDGAPAWTIEKIGMDLERLDAVGAALTQQHYGKFHKDAYPRMIWPTNYSRYAAATMLTLFFAGKTYAPETQIEGENVQDWLQERYLACMRHAFRRLKNCKALVGWGTMNEPQPGFVGCRDLETLENAVLTQGALPSPLEAMALASGHPMETPVYTTGIRGIRILRRELINPDGVSLFKEGFTCPWKRAGVWTDGEGRPQLLRRDHFASYEGKNADFVEHFLTPFMERCIERLRDADPAAIFFIEGIPGGRHPSWSPEKHPLVVNAFHWYDGLTLYLKSFRPWFNINTLNRKIVLGRKRVAAMYAEQIGIGTAWTREHMGDIPCLLGEFGLPFDMNRRRAFKTGDYRLHEEALSMYYDAIDAHLLHSTIWNYTADNTHEWGDLWNDEDLSIFSEGRGRALGGWLRPYPMATGGIPLGMGWNRKKGRFWYRCHLNPSISAPTEIFAPLECFGTNPALTVDCPGGAVRAEYNQEARRIYLWNDGFEGEVLITVQAARDTVCRK